MPICDSLRLTRRKSSGATLACAYPHAVSKINSHYFDYPPLQFAKRPAALVALGVSHDEYDNMCFTPIPDPMVLIRFACLGDKHNTRF